MPEHAPETVANFVQLAKGEREWRDPRDGAAKREPLYAGTVFHRVIPDFMIQGGGMLPGLREKQTKAPIKNESTNGLTNQKYTLAMARTGVPDSATSQFFINVTDNTFLDRANSRDGVGYCVFGKVIEGLDVVDKIAAVKTGDRGFHQDVPVQDVILKSVRRAEK